MAPTTLSMREKKKRGKSEEQNATLNLIAGKDRSKEL